MKSKLKAIGLKRDYKPRWNEESEVIEFHVRKPYEIRIIDGKMKGCDADLYDDQTVRIWTDKAKKAEKLSIIHSLRYRKYTGSECELYIPIALCDELLPQFGVRVKRIMSDKQIDAMRTRFKSSILGGNPR